MKSVGKLLLKLLIIFVAMVAAGYFLLVLVYCIPRDRMDANFALSYRNFEEQSWYIKLIPDRSNTTLDNFCDERILFEASNPNERGPFIDALTNPFVYTPEEHIMASVIKYNDDVRGITTGGSVPRYWHGYLIFVKPLFYLLDYNQIKYVLMMTHTALFTVAIVLMAKRKSRGVVPLLCYWLTIVPVAVMMNLEFTPMNLLVLAELIFILLFYDRFKECGDDSLVIFFFVAGALTSYFDYLTYPIVSFCIPFIFLMMEFGKGFLKSVLQLLKTGVAWCAGYLLYWGAKWVLATIFTEQNIIQDALGQIRGRTGMGGYPYSEVIRRVLTTVNKYFVAMALLWLLGCVVYVIIKKQKLQLGLIPVFAFIMVVPFAWFYVLRNHTYIHYWFSFRNVGATVFAIAALGDMFRRQGDGSVSQK